MRTNVFMLILVSLLTIKAQNKCGKKWIHFNGFCYWLGGDRSLLGNFSTAMTECSDDHASVLAITNAEEKEFISKTILTFGHKHNKSLNETRVWLDKSSYRGSDDVLSINDKVDHQLCEYFARRAAQPEGSYYFGSEFCSAHNYIICKKTSNHNAKDSFLLQLRCPECKRRRRRSLRGRFNFNGHDNNGVPVSPGWLNPFRGPFSGYSRDVNPYWLDPQLMHVTEHPLYPAYPTTVVPINPFYYVRTIQPPRIPLSGGLGSWIDNRKPIMIQKEGVRKDNDAEKVSLDPGCKQNEFSFRNSCYFLNATLTTFGDAEAMCYSSVSGYLVSIGESGEYNFLSSELQGKIANGSALWINLQKSTNTNSLRFQEITSYDLRSKYIRENRIGWTCGASSFERNDFQNDSVSFSYCDSLKPFLCEYKKKNGFKESPSTYESEGKCPPGWVFVMDECFKEFTDSKNWEDAGKVCAMSGGTLLSIKDFRSFLQISELFKDEQGFIRKARVWLAHSAFKEKAPKGIVIIKRITDTPKYNGACDFMEVQRHLFKALYIMGEGPCNEKLAFICQKEKETNILFSGNEKTITSSATTSTTKLPPKLVDEEPCPNPASTGWEKFGGFCYLFVTYTKIGIPLSWGLARVKCAQKNSHLASLHSEEENVWVNNKIKTFMDNFLWVGGKYDGNNSFIWEDGSPFDYQNWNVGEPNNLNDKEECITVYSHSNGKWNDDNCNQFAGFICKKPVFVEIQKTARPARPVAEAITTQTTTEGVSSFTAKRNVSTTTPTTINSILTTSSTTHATVVQPASNEKFSTRTGGGCPYDWNQMDRKCVKYIRSSTNIQHYQAEANCATLSKDASLVSVHSAKEMAFLSTLMTSYDDVWIGAKYSMGKESFFWLDGSEFNYTYWGKNQPTMSPENKEYFVVPECVLVSNKYGEEFGYWADRNCLTAYADSYICQMPLDPIHKPVPFPFQNKCSAPRGNFWSFGSSCYLFVNKSLSWQAAEAECATMDSHLVSIENYSEFGYIWSQFGSLEQRNFWIGLRHEGYPMEQHTVWNNGWQPIFTNWGPNEPSPISTKSCVFMDKNEGTWKPTQCFIRKPFICEYSPKTDSLAYGGCPKYDWFDFGGKFCYNLNKHQRVTWAQANHSCVEQGGHLASVHAKREAENLKKIVAALRFSIWIGLLLPKNKGIMWSDSSPFDYTEWSPKEPNDPNEECAEMMNRGGLWNDVNCATRLAYVCQVPKETFAEYGSENGTGGGTVAGIILIVVVVVIGLAFAAHELHRRYRIFAVTNSLKFDNVAYNSENMTVAGEAISSSREASERILDSDHSSDQDEENETKIHEEPAVSKSETEIKNGLK